MAIVVSLIVIALIVIIVILIVVKESHDFDNWISHVRGIMADGVASQVLKKVERKEDPQHTSR